MALVPAIKDVVVDTIPSTPIYLAVGVTDLAAEQLRRASTHIYTARGWVSVNPWVVERKAREQVKNVPSALLRRGGEVAGSLQERHDALAARGEHLVDRIQDQRATRDLVAQFEQTASFAKGALTTVRAAASRTGSSAKATVTTGRHQAERLGDVVSGVVLSDVTHMGNAAVESVSTIADEAAKARKRTTSAAKRTRTTARHGIQASTSRTKAAATVARKNAGYAAEAAEAAVEKIGDVPSAKRTTGTRLPVKVGPVKAIVRTRDAGGTSKTRDAGGHQGARTVRAAGAKANNTSTRAADKSGNGTSKKPATKTGQRTLGAGPAKAKSTSVRAPASKKRPRDSSHEAATARSASATSNVGTTD
jgi:heparin binding hemagglutinin HbhA